MEELITAKQAEAELGISRRTIQRWEEYGWFTKGLVKKPNGTRVYKRSHLQWSNQMAGIWEPLREDDLTHLRKWPAIQKKLDRLLRTEPLERTNDPEPFDREAWKDLMKEREQWNKEHAKLQKRYVEFFDVMKLYGRN